MTAARCSTFTLTALFACAAAFSPGAPAGGFWCNPPNWKRNTAIAAGVWAACLYMTFKWSAANERRYMPPVNYPIPSQYWCKHAVEDDPRLAAMGWGPKPKAEEEDDVDDEGEAERDRRER